MNNSLKHSLLSLFTMALLFGFCSTMSAQNGEKVFRFLNLPNSARVNAMGGNNVSLAENDISLVFQNPALLGGEMNMNLNVNYMSYIDDIGVGSAIFGKSLTDISSFAVGVHYFNYGKFRETTEENQTLGDFSSKDIAINGVYARDLSERWRGGVTAKFIYSSYESYSSFAVGFDAGLSYYDPDGEFSAALVLKNVGTQVSAYNDKRVGLPWDVQVGLSKKMNHAPIRLSLTGIYLTQWDFAEVNAANGLEPSDDNFFKTLFKHMVIGVDLIPSENFWVGIGYNPKINSDMKVLDGSKWGGWNAGAGVRIKKFNVGFALSQYHASATSYQFSVGVDLSKY